MTLTGKGIKEYMLDPKMNPGTGKCRNLSAMKKEDE